MNPRNSSLLCLAVLLGLSLCLAIEAFDVTKMLGQYPELSKFNKYLTETKLADQINGLKTVTILAVDDSSISDLSGKSADAVKAILSNHVVLEYLDEQKLMTAVESQQSQLTTLYQPAAGADKLLRFIKVGLVGEGEISFGPAVNGASLGSDLVKTVTTQPGSISIVQITKPIIAPGIDSQAPAPSNKATAPASNRMISPGAGPSGEAKGTSTANGSSRIQMGLGWAVIMGLGALLVL